MHLPHFPPPKTHSPHISSDYYIVGFTVYAISVCLTSDVEGIHEIQNMWGFWAWVCLFILLRGETRQVKTQVFIAIVFATLGEYFASIYMGGYIYQSNTIPMYIPAGHGMVYLSAVALGRSGLFQRHARIIAIGVLIIGGLWSIWGLSDFAPQRDVTGAILFSIFLLCVLKGRNPMVYLGAFFITTHLELVGTLNANWTWVIIDPASQLPQGNPPSGVAAYYCLVDAVAIGLSPVILRAYDASRGMMKHTTD
jgi:hypothetical protein